MIGESIVVRLRELEPDDTEPSYTGAFRDACRLAGDPAFIRRYKGCCVITRSKSPFRVYEGAGASRFYYKRVGLSDELAPLFSTLYKNVLVDMSYVKYEFE